MNIFRLSREVFHSRESILNWCREKNLLPHPDTVICPREIRKKSQNYFSTVIENIAACDWSEFSEEI